MITAVVPYEGDVINYVAEPTIELFHLDPSFVRGILGPIGSGKSVGCISELLRIAFEVQQPYQGVRYTRMAVIRNTYGELKSTTIKTFEERTGFAFNIVYDSPIRCHIRVRNDKDGTIVDSEWLFIALDKPKDVKKLKSLELTAGFINEAAEVPKAVVDMMTGRVGRYPPKRLGGPTRACVVMDSNAMDDDHWWYQLAEVVKPDKYRFFRQPPALIKVVAENGRKVRYYPNPRAENVHNQPLGYDYWLNQVPGKTVDWIDRYVLGNYGSTADGKPVYPEYNDLEHCPGFEPQVYRALPLLLGFDAGLTPACAICQLSPNGRLIVLDELCAEYMGMKQFARDVVKPHLLTHYAGMRWQVVYDPAADTPDGGDIESSPAKALELAGFGGDPAPTNDYQPRRDSLADFMKRHIDGGPGLWVSPKAKMIRAGLRGAYCYERVQVTGEERYKDQPKKNRYSHPVEAAQYVALKLLAGYADPTRTRARPVEAGVPAAGWT